VGSADLWEECCLGEDFRGKNFQVYKVEYDTNLMNVAKILSLDPVVLSILNKKSFEDSVSSEDEIILPFHIHHSPYDQVYRDLYNYWKPKRKKTVSRSRSSFLSWKNKTKRKNKNVMKSLPSKNVTLHDPTMEQSFKRKPKT
jgi:hypothetical protein